MGQKQPLSIFTERGDVADERADADIQYVSLPQDFFAWMLSFYQMAFDEVSNQWVQTVSFRNKKPIRVFKEWPDIDDSPIDNTAEDKFDEALAIRDEERHKDSAQLWWAIIAVVILLAITILVLFKLK